MQHILCKIFDTICGMKYANIALAYMHPAYNMQSFAYYMQLHIHIICTNGFYMLLYKSYIPLMHVLRTS